MRGGVSCRILVPVKPKQNQNMINVKELMRTTTEPLTAATLRELLEAQRAAEVSRVEIVKPLNLWK